MKLNFSICFSLLALALVQSCNKGNSDPTVTYFPPTLTTKNITEISITSASSGGEITNDGGTPILSEGICWDINPDPTNSKNFTILTDGLKSFTSSMTNLKNHTKYYVRSYAQNNAGISYGNSISFTTLDFPAAFNSSLNYGTMSDIDGNVYKTIAIGTQVWMAENLRTTRFSDGSPILFIETSSAWSNLTTSDNAYCWYNNDSTYKSIYGAMYNYNTAVNGAPPSDNIPSGVQGVCPTGWHLPSLSEWNILISFLGLNSGGLMKESGFNHWNSPNSEATNHSGFTAVPGGAISSGVFSFIGERSIWFSVEHKGLSTSNNAIGIHNTGAGVYYYILRYYEGVSVRCIKD